MRTNSNLLRLMMALAVAGFTAACGGGSTTETTTEEVTEETSGDETEVAEEGPGTIVEVAQTAGTFTTLVTAVQTAGLVDALSGDNELTVFAPTDEAFAASLEELGFTAEQILAEENRQLLTNILLFHVVSGSVPASAVLEMDGETVPTLLEGQALTVTVADGSVQVGTADRAAVVQQTDIPASNGVIHVIDRVLVPAL